MASWKEVNGKCRLSSRTTILRDLRELSQRRRKRQRELQKAKALNKQNSNNSARAARNFCTFPCRHCTTSNWNSLTERLLEDVSTPRRSFSLLNLGSVPNNSIPRKFTCIWHFEWVEIIASTFLTVTFPLPSPSSLLKVMLHGTHSCNIWTMMQPFETMSQQWYNAVLR